MKYSKELVKEICEHIEDGHYLKDAAELAGVSESTFYHWKKTKSEFSESIRRALMRYKDKLLKLFHGSATERRDARAALEMLGRRFPDQWGEKLKMEIAVNPKEEMDKIMDVLKKKWPDQETTTKESPPPSSKTQKETPTS